MKDGNPSQALVIAVLVIIELLFSLSYILSKQLIHLFPPLIWATIRSIATAITMLALTLLFKKPHPKINLAYLRPLIFLSLLGGVGVSLTFLIGLYYTSSTNSAIIYTITPIFTLIIVTFLGQEKCTLMRATGFGISFIGVLTLRRVEEYQFSNRGFTGDLITLLSCICYGIYLVASKDFFKKYDRMWALTWIFFVTSLILSAVSFQTWRQFNWPIMSLNLWIIFGYGIIGATLVTYFLLNWVISYAPASQVAIFTYIQPITVSIITFFFLNETFTKRQLLGTLLIFIGVGFALRTSTAQPSGKLIDSSAT